MPGFGWDKVPKVPCAGMTADKKCANALGGGHDRECWLHVGLSSLFGRAVRVGLQLPRQGVVRLRGVRGCLSSAVARS